MQQPLPPFADPDYVSDSPTVRVTVPVRQDVLETFQRLAKAGSMSTGRAMGDWLADTIEAAQFMAEKMEQARAAPKIVIREMHAYAQGMADETGALMEQLRQKGRTDRASARRSRAPAHGTAGSSPPSNTGVTTTKKRPGKGGTDAKNAR